MAGLRFKLDWSGMKDQFKRQAQAAAKSLAIKAREEICNEYIATIGDFYAEFSPRVWKRQYGYYKSYIPYYENSHGWIYYGGIDIHNAGMPEGHYLEGPNAAINTMLAGIHGPQWGYGPTGIPVGEHMQNYVQMLANYISL